jgi:hypothetical protein
MLLINSNTSASFSSRAILCIPVMQRAPRPHTAAAKKWKSRALLKNIGAGPASP